MLNEQFPATEAANPITGGWLDERHGAEFLADCLEILLGRLATYAS